MTDKQVMARRRIGHLESGRLEIPTEFQEAIGAQPDDALEMHVVNDEIHLKRVDVGAQTLPQPWLQELYEYFRPYREEAEVSGMTDDEINEAIDEAFRAVRSNRG